MSFYTDSDRSHVARILGSIDGDQAGQVTAGHPPSSLVQSSWRRCVSEYGLNPADVRDIDVATSGETRVRAQSLAEMLPAALMVIPDLGNALRDYPHILLLSDADGVLLHRLSDPGSAEFAARIEVSPGAIWSERRQGTNGLGTSLACGRTAAVHKADHFAPGNAWLSCVSTPLRSPSGQITGALNVTFLQKDRMLSGSIVEYLMEKTGRRIEDAFLRSRHLASWLLSLDDAPGAVGIDRPVFAIDQSERIAGMNEAARRLFPGTRGSPMGQLMHQAFGRSLDDVLRAREADMAIPLSVGGRELFAQLRPPARRMAKSHPPRTQAVAAATPPALAQVVGRDQALAAKVARLCRFLDHKVPILIGGETGTGKEVLARALHAASSRRAKPFVAVNCAALPEALIESELFGYADGAFTGASRRGYQGKVMQASGGTLFLDEIGDMPLAMQTRLLRVLTQEEVSPLGSDKVLPVDLNVISASHCDLAALVANGSFRADLFFRLRGVDITLPALRVRPDRLFLIRAMLQDEAGRHGVDVELDPEAERILMAYGWPGNMRELRHSLRAAVIACESDRLVADDLPQALAAPPALPGQYDIEVREGNDTEKADLLQSLRRHRWSVSLAARDLGLSRQSVYRAMQRFAIVPPNKAG